VAQNLHSPQDRALNSQPGLVLRQNVTHRFQVRDSHRLIRLFVRPGYRNEIGRKPKLKPTENSWAMELAPQVGVVQAPGLTASSCA
jgi:hypothetical protein